MGAPRRDGRPRPPAQDLLLVLSLLVGRDVLAVNEVGDRVEAAAKLAQYVADGEVDPAVGLPGIIGLLERAQSFLQGDPLP